MTTYAPAATVLNHTTDPGYQAWATEFFNAWTNGAYSLGGTIYASMQVTADTGQLASATLAAAVRPAINTATGYIVLAFNDSMQSTAPIFIKLEVGTGSATTTPAIWITVGGSSNGAGTIGNVMLARTQYNLTPVSTVTTYTTWACGVAGQFALVFKQQGLTSNVSMIFLFGRTFDPATGSPTADGWFIVFNNGNANSTAINVQVTGGVPAAYASTSAFCMIPNGITNSLVGGVAQPFKWYAAVPKILPLPFLCALNTEAANLTEFDAQPFGSATRHFKFFQQGGSQNYNYNNQAGVNLGFIWE